MRKVLILAGLKVENELADAETLQLIQKVLANFDPRKSLDTEELMFESRFEMFEQITGDGRRGRNVATKNVSEAYLRSVERNEKE